MWLSLGLEDIIDEARIDTAVHMGKTRFSNATESSFCSQDAFRCVSKFTRMIEVIFKVQ